MISIRSQWLACMSVVATLSAGLAGCGSTSSLSSDPLACTRASCRLSLTLGPGDGAYIPGALEATADAFLQPTSNPPTGTGSGATASPGNPPSLRIQLDRDTLSPSSGTAYTETRNQSIGLRGEASQPLLGALDGYAAVSVAIGRHDYALPQGLGPLIDPIKVRFQTVSATPEIGLRYDQPLTFLNGISLRLSAGTGVVFSHTRTHLTSALLNVSSATNAAQPFVGVAAGVIIDPPGRGRAEFLTGGRMGKGGAAVLRSEFRLAR